MTGDNAPQEYLRDRVEQYRGWYDARARSCKTWYLRLQVTTFVLAGSVPVLLTLPVASSRLLGVLASVAVLLAMALDRVLHLREQWRNYRYTEQYLDKERFLYRNSAGPYRGLPAQDAFLRFVERVEWAIAAENTTTLATLALSPEVRLNGGPQ